MVQSPHLMLPSVRATKTLDSFLTENRVETKYGALGDKQTDAFLVYM